MRWRERIARHVYRLPEGTFLPGLVVVLWCIAAVPASGSEGGDPLRLTREEIVAENPAATQRLIGAFSGISGLPQGERPVKVYMFDDTEYVCVAALKAGIRDAMDCWRSSDAPASLRKVMEGKETRPPDRE